MPLPRNPLVEDLLQLADGLAMQTGRASLQQAALRRAVSTAYYAFFHILCTLCSDSLVRWGRTDLVDRTYRSLDHGTARRRLAVLATMPKSGAPMRRVSTLFSLLQDRRNEADYERPRGVAELKRGAPPDPQRPRGHRPPGRDGRGRAAAPRCRAAGRQVALTGLIHRMRRPPCRRHTPRLSPARHKSESTP